MVAETAVGVPEIAPVVVLNVKPPGKLGEMLNLVEAPPVFTGERPGIAIPDTK